MCVEVLIIYIYISKLSKFVCTSFLKEAVILKWPHAVNLFGGWCSGSRWGKFPDCFWKAVASVTPVRILVFQPVGERSD
uniref:Uncharacterized protein n=1 Tax=Anguilla anguilla TaxID=7936 RepID=A0A0E9R683_ANGAN